jgi:hypothetical protein
MMLCQEFGVFADIVVVPVAAALVVTVGAAAAAAATVTAAAAAMYAVVTGQHRLYLNCLAIRPVPER